MRSPRAPRARSKNVRQTGLRAEILVNIMLITAAAMFLIGIIAFKLTERSAVEGNINGVKAVIAALEGSYLKNGDLTGGAEFLKGVLNPGAWGIIELGGRRVYFDTGKSGEAEARTDPLLLQARTSGNTVVGFEGANFPPFTTFDGLKIAAPVKPAGGPGGAVFVYQPLAPLEESLLLNRRLISLWIILFLVIITLFGFYILSRRIVRPVHELIKTTEKIGTGKFYENADVGKVKEINRLYDALRKMYGEIEGGKRKLGDKIAELEEANAELRLVQKELVAAEKLASLGRLSAGIAHEIGNPLSAIRGYTEVMTRAVDMDHEMRASFLKNIQDEVTRIDRIIRTLLDYSRPKSVSLRTLDVNEAAVKTAEIINSQGVLKKVGLRLELTPGLPLVEADPGQLSQVLINLILNARDAVDGGGEIVISTSADGSGEVTIAVSDTGPGISPEIRDKIFDPFFTTKEPGQGTGLGLSVSARIVETFGGRIDVKSEPGNGAAFSLVFPAAGEYNNAESSGN